MRRKTGNLSINGNPPKTGEIVRALVMSAGAGSDSLPHEVFGVSSVEMVSAGSSDEDGALWPPDRHFDIDATGRPWTNRFKVAAEANRALWRLRSLSVSRQPSRASHATSSQLSPRRSLEVEVEIDGRDPSSERERVSPRHRRHRRPLLQKDRVRKFRGGRRKVT